MAKGRLVLRIKGTGQLWPFQLRKLEALTGRGGLAEALDSGEWFTVFDHAVEDVRVVFPWYTFSGGMNLTAHGVRYRLSFGRPANNADPTLDELRRNLGSLKSMRSIGQNWRDVLQPPDRW